MSVVVVGLGNIGLAVGRRLTMRGRDVVGIDLSEERRAVWRALTGREAAGGLGEVAWVDVAQVFVVVRLASQAEAVLAELDQLDLPAPVPAFVMTTLDAETAGRLDRFDHRSLRVIELPVSGGELGALGGQLTVLPAGRLTEGDRRFLLATVAARVVPFERFGEPTLAKLVNNVLAAYNTAALSSLLDVAGDAGLDAARVYEVVRHGSGGSWMADSFFELVVDLLEKDVALLADHVGALPEVVLAPGSDLVGLHERTRDRLSVPEEGPPR